ncbi:hypothetical protein BV20DRAFT_1050019 [Pilatotrama ljubarskyi]|nr:hypothetical protein BV20DRAFT_1058077 [Pilatotrama ljubarskyi]KAI0373093.1 hypothetical protein BV20DRAFT_1050019 [Pilatotrama ljubarskyi]
MSISHGEPLAIIAKPILPAKKRKPPQLSRERRIQIAQDRKARQNSIEEDIREWYDDSIAFAEDLHNRFPQKSADHYVHMMFTGAEKLRSTRQPNSYNAWLHHLSQHNASGANAIELGQQRMEEYNSLTDAEKEKLLEQLVENRTSKNYGLRLDKRGRVQDVNHVLKKIEDALLGLQSRVGIEAFFCVVRNNPEYDMKPRWWFSRAELEDYLRNTVRKFAPERIGILAEAFAISGTDFVSQLKNSKEKIAYLKGEIRDLVQEQLAEITGDKDLRMSYVQFTRDIEIPYAVTIVGWAGKDKQNPRPWVNPSQLSNDLELLKGLRSDLLTGECAFVRLTPQQHEATKDAYNQRVEAGDVPQRKKRKDAGVKRKKRADRAEDSSNKRPHTDAGGPDPDASLETSADA